jgi:hypothetical protein
MIALAPGTKVFLACQPIDLRAGFDGLAAKVQQIIGADPFSGHVFIFRSKRGHYLKGLYWDGSGLCLFANYLASYCISSNQMRGSCGDGGLGCRCAVDEPVPSAAMLGRWV